ncbi:MAG: phosphotriesterase [Chloroflexi bacterium RBG_16_68_14]|nr:MAG: phosphotriesterase [Chloroflexi bacterium RBG_16_68_14]
MPQVETLRGPIDTAQLGFTLMHEHVFVLSQGVPESFPSVWDEEAQIASAREKLRELADLGVQTFVDLTVLGLGRNIPRLQRALEGISLNVIIATGLYTYNELPQYFQNRDIDVMVDLFVRDITGGIQGTKVKAAILKCATDEPGVTPGVEKVLRAVARAHRRTGAPISTHTHSGTRRGLDQQKVFAEEGVDLGRVIIGHSGDTEDIGYLEEMLKRGSYLGMDRFGIDIYLPTEKRVAVIARLCELGYADRLVLSHDASCYIDWYPAELVRSTVPNWHFRHISEDALPALRKAGVNEEQIRQMTVESPRRIFEHSGPY